MRKIFLACWVLAALVIIGLFQWYPSRFQQGFNPLVDMVGDLQHDVARAGHRLTPFSTAWEIQIGNEMAASLERQQGFLGRRAETAPWWDYVNSVGQELVKNVQRKDIPYRFHVIESHVTNAFAIAGGHIYVTTGMLKLMKSEAELAAVLGHEISHVDLKHCINSVKVKVTAERVGGPALGDIAALTAGLFRSGFDEKEEIAADSFGIQLAARAKYDPNAVLVFRERMLKEKGPVVAKTPAQSPVEEAKSALSAAVSDYFLTHPPYDQRLKILRRVIERDKYTRRGRFYIGKSNYENRRSRAEWPVSNEWIAKKDEK